MNRFEIAKGHKPPVPKPADDYNVPEGFLKKCELWREKEDGTVQGVVCLLKSLNVYRSEAYQNPYQIKTVLRIPAGFFIELRRPLLMKMKDQEYRITPLEVNQDYERPDVDVTLAGTVRFRDSFSHDYEPPLRRQPSSYRDVMDQLQDRLSEKSRQQNIE